MSASSAADAIGRLELWLGEATPQAARVYARLPATPAGGPQRRLVGTIRGPHSAYAHTLPTTAAFRPLGADGDALLAAALVVDPCFWTPESPNLYDCRLELQEAGAPVASLERCFGMRRLAVRGGDFVWEGRRWVLRGATLANVADEPLATWRETDTAIVAEQIDDRLAAEASRVGVLLVADFSARHPGPELAAELRRLAAWPAVGLAILPDCQHDLHALPGNLPVGYAAPHSPAGTKRPEVPFLVWSLSPDDSGEQGFADVCQASAGDVGIVVRRPLRRRLSVAEARRACDRLQSDLAAAGQFAGYIV